MVSSNFLLSVQIFYRWMNNLLMRELPLGATIRLWDTYLSEGSGRAFADFHVYVCAAFLRLWSAQLQQQKDFQVGLFASTYLFVSRDGLCKRFIWP